jgi:hypothetical protein
MNEEFFFGHPSSLETFSTAWDSFFIDSSSYFFKNREEYILNHIWPAEFLIKNGISISGINTHPKILIREPFRFLTDDSAGAWPLKHPSPIQLEKLLKEKGALWIINNHTECRETFETTYKGCTDSKVIRGISKASEASTSAATATTKASEATTAKNAAVVAQAAAEAALDTFDDRFLGAKSSDPSVDNDGNETISSQTSYLLDSVGPTSGTFTINDLQDNAYLRSTSEITVTPADWSDNTGISYYAMGIGSSGDDTSADIVGYQNVGTTTIALTGLSLDDYTGQYVKLYAVDGAGNLSTLVINSFMTYNTLLGDYDTDWDVDVEDLNSFVNAWPSVDLGPATGTSPYLTPSLDGSADINDVSVFTRNWQWTKAQGKTSESEQEQKLNPINFPAELFGNQIKITLPDNITAGRFEIINEGNVYQFSVAKNNQSMIILENNDSLEETYEFEFGRLSQDEKELFIYIDGDAPRSEIEVSYQLFSKDGAAGNGVMELGNPDEFKLYQNYPNPFNSQTTFQYDVAEVTSVKIYIYNTLGQLVKTIDQGENSVGTHTVEWDGKNDDGDTLSSGVYFYQLRTKDFNKTMKMLLVK